MRVGDRAIEDGLEENDRAEFFMHQKHRQHRG